MSIPFGKRQALHEILLNYANDDASTTTTTIDAILGLLDCDGSSSPTPRDQFAMAAMIADSIQSAIVAAAYIAQGKRFDGDVPNLSTAVKEHYETADAMLEARKK